MSAETEAPELISAGTQEMVTGARRLGLTWRMQLGTVFSGDPLKVTVDGDTTPIGMVSTVGQLQPDDRVYVLAVPPSGNFVTGLVTPRHIEIGKTGVQVTPAATSFTQAVSFTTTFASIPVITIGIVSGNGETAQWNVRAINPSTTGFTIFLYRTVGMAANAWTAEYDMHWHAIE
jgi:hypothetical protein